MSSSQDYLATPASRYGGTSDVAAWWAIADYTAFSYATGDDNGTAQSMNYFMSLAVNHEPSRAPHQ